MIVELGLKLAQEAVRVAEETGLELHNYLNTVAVALHRAGDNKGAIEVLRRAIALSPDNKGYQNNLAHFESAAHDGAVCSW